MMDIEEFEKRFKKKLEIYGLSIGHKLEVTTEELVKMFTGFVVISEYEAEQIKKHTPTKIPSTFDDMKDLINGLKEKGNE